MKLKIQYPDHAEAVDAEEAGKFWRLKGHSLFLPLSPGDLVTAMGRIVTGVHELAPVFMVEAYFPLLTRPEEVRQKAAEWSTATSVTQSTNLTVLVSSESRAWIEDVVQPAVDWVDLLRVPGQGVNYMEEVRRA